MKEFNEGSVDPEISNSEKQEQENPEFNLEKLKAILQSKGIQLEETRIEAEIVAPEDINFAALTGQEDKAIITKNLRKSYTDIWRFLTEFYYIIDNFRNDHKARQEMKYGIMEEVTKQYGKEAAEFVKDVYTKSKMRNNVLNAINVEQIIRIIGGNPRCDKNTVDKIQELLNQFKGENDPLNYEGEERLERVKNLDKTLQQILIEIKELLNKLMN